MLQVGHVKHSMQQRQAELSKLSQPALSQVMVLQTECGQGSQSPHSGAAIAVIGTNDNTITNATSTAKILLFFFFISYPP